MMSDTVIIASIGGAVSIIGTVFGGIIAYMLAKINKRGQRAAQQTIEIAAKTEEVKTALQANNLTTDMILKIIHVLGNSTMQAQLSLTAIAMRRIAVLTGTPDDKAAADLAEKLLMEHQVKQSFLDMVQGVA